MTNPSPDLLPSQLAEFVQYRWEYLTGDEKGEAQVFCDRLFRAFGHGGVREAGATLEMRLKKNDSRGTAFADLMWKPRCLIEMKKAGTDLSRTYRQAFDYWVAAVPNRPRYVILCNFDEFWVYDFDNQLDAPVDRVALSDLPHRWDALAFLLPQAAEPVFGNDLVAVTREAAGKVGLLFRTLEERGIDRGPAQRFVLQSVMAMFAEDVGLLPSKLFSRALNDSTTPTEAYDVLFGLFREMNTPGLTPAGRYRGTPYFNGGLFAEITPLEITAAELTLLREAAATDWSVVRPEIFGTLFEGSMDKGERHAHGAHFTSQADIAKVVIPTIVTPWRERLAAAGSINELELAIADLYSFRVLDPACGSGNFLYVAYREMRRLEHEARELIVERRRSANIAAQGTLSYVTPDQFYGIDRNAFAVEVAKVTMMLATKLAADELSEDQQVLPLDNLDVTIVAGDALFTDWPKADAVIGNPPYLGRRKMVDELGAGYASRLAEAYPSIGGVSDYVCYWFPRSHDHLPPGGRAGLVATATIRENDSRKASTDYLVDHDGVIVEAVSSQPWSGDAVVHVSIVNWVKQPDEATAAKPKVLWLNDGGLRLEVPTITSALAARVDVRTAVDIPANAATNLCHQGQTPGVTVGFILNTDDHERLIATNDGSAAHVHPFLGGDDILKKTQVDRWVIDLPQDELIAAQTAAPALLKHLKRIVLPIRQQAANKEAARNAVALAENPSARTNRHHAAFLSGWWRLGYRRADMLAEFNKIDRYIATSRVASKNRDSVFEFVDISVRPGDSMSVVTLDDDYSFGVLSSAFHRAWLEARCSTLKGDLRYTPTTVWNSFPWPQSPTSASVATIVEVVVALLDYRAGYLAQGVSLAKQYDALRQPGKSRLRGLHLELDAAVGAAYGTSASGDTVAKLFALNQHLAASAAVRGPGAGDLAGTRVTNYRRGISGSISTI